MDDREQIAAIKLRFKALVQQRCMEFAVPVPTDEPHIELDLFGQPKAQWYVVHGMYGGFAYTLARTGDELRLHCASWCRVVEGSEEKHEITALDSVKLPVPWNPPWSVE